MRSLAERLYERKVEYEEVVEREKLVQTYLDKLTTLVPKNTNIHGVIYRGYTLLYLLFDNVEDFEEEFITPISEAFNITWRRLVESQEVRHQADITVEDNDYVIYLVVRSRPADSCRITKVATGKTVRRSKYIEVEEPEYEYLVECSDD